MTKLQVETLEPERQRILKPYRSQHRYKHLNIILVNEDHNQYWREDTDTHGTCMSDLLHISRSLIVVDDSASWAKSTNRLLDIRNSFDYDLGVFTTTLVDIPECEVENEVCFAWGLRPKLRHDLPGNNRNDNWHMVFDPSVIVGRSNLGQFSDNNDLLKLAYEYRDWCKSRNIPISLSKGSAAGRVLRGLVRESQVKVPYATNQNCRKALGANLTIANTHGRTELNVTEFDQRSAQHLVAKDLHLPDRNSFLASGDFNRQETVFFYPGTQEFHDFTTQVERGILLCEVEQWDERAYRTRYKWSPYHPFTGDPLWLSTNELSLVKRCGIRITGIIAAWTSGDRSTELHEHAVTSLEELDHATDFTKSWLKPINLAVYGTTAARAMPTTRRTLRAVDICRAPSERITNHVCWLAMIQREVRKRSVMFALDLIENEIPIVGIYVDAVYVKVGNHDIGGLVPRYFVEKSKGPYDGKGMVRIFNGRTVFPGILRTDPDRESKAREFIAS